MSFAGFLRDTCDIYHLRRDDLDIGYGVPPGEGADFDYPDEPDEADVPCHFQRRGGGGTLREGLPQLYVEGNVKLNIGKDVDIRLRDKIVDRRTGLAYTAGIPQNIRQSHTAVILTRLYGQGEL